MKETFKHMPSPLQKIAIFRASGILLGCLICLFALLAGSDWTLMIPGVLIALFFFAGTYYLILQYQSGAILAIEGTCIGIERTAIRKRIQSIYLKTDQLDLKIITHKSPSPAPASGDILIFYILRNAAIYDIDGYQVIYSCLAIQKGRHPKQKLTH